MKIAVKILWVKITLVIVLAPGNAICRPIKDSLLVPQVGKQIPEFRLTNVKYFKETSVQLKDFQGKWLILDFWNRSCVVCISSFPKIDSLQRKFKDKVQFLLIGDNSRRYNSGIEEVYKKISERKKLSLTYTFDSTMFKQYEVPSVPHYVIVDPEGIVYAITAMSEIQEAKLDSLFSGKQPHMINKLSRNDRFRTVDIFKPLYLNGNVDDDDAFDFRSIMGKWKPSQGHNVYVEFDRFVDSGYFSAVGSPLEWLYNFAYFGRNLWYANHANYGKISRRPLLVMADTTLFKKSFNSGEGLYNYSLTVPKVRANRKYMMNVMQRDLKSYFGYDAAVENRMVECWELTVKPTAVNKLRSKHNIRVWNGDWLGLEAKRIAIKDVIYVLDYFNPQSTFIDKTGIDFQIDVNIDAVMTDFDAVKTELEKQGLQLNKGKVQMQVLVLSNSQVK